MSQDLPEKLLGISIDDPGDRRSDPDEDADTEELERFVFFSIGDQRLAVSVDDVKTVTNLPSTVTRVPRSPEAIDGVVDFRGDITVVVDPRIHFPVPEDPADDQRLIVFDRTTEQQSAAIRVDDVQGVESVPASNVVGREDFEDGAVDRALEHPLITGIVKQEHQVTVRSLDGDDGAESSIQPEVGAGAELGSDLGPGTDFETPSSRGAGAGSTAGANRSRDGSSIQSPSTSVRQSEDSSPPSLAAARDQTSSEAFDDLTDGSDAEDDRADAETAPEPEVVTTVTALVDVDRLLLASGRVD